MGCLIWEKWPNYESFGLAGAELRMLASSTFEDCLTYVGFVLRILT